MSPLVGFQANLPYVDLGGRSGIRHPILDLRVHIRDPIVDRSKCPRDPNATDIRGRAFTADEDGTDVAHSCTNLGMPHDRDWYCAEKTDT